jgi:hypothetical protein
MRYNEGSGGGQNTTKLMNEFRGGEVLIISLYCTNTNTVPAILKIRLVDGPWKQQGQKGPRQQNATNHQNGDLPHCASKTDERRCVIHQYPRK